MVDHPDTTFGTMNDDWPISTCGSRGVDKRANFAHIIENSPWAE